MEYNKTLYVIYIVLMYFKSLKKLMKDMNPKSVCNLGKQIGICDKS